MLALNGYTSKIIEFFWSRWIPVFLFCNVNILTPELGICKCSDFAIIKWNIRTKGTNLRTKLFKQLHEKSLPIMLIIFSTDRCFLLEMVTQNLLLTFRHFLLYWHWVLGFKKPDTVFKSLSSSILVKFIFGSRQGAAYMQNNCPV